jgi:hypothetical protein
MNRRAVLIGAGIVAAVALVWFATRLERVPETEQTGYTGEARRNPYLAALRLARRMGFAANELKAAPELDRLPAAAVLLLPNRRQALTPTQRARLMSWVKGGGHLILEAEDVAVSDPYTDALGVRRGGAERESGKRGPVMLPQAPAPLQLSAAALGTRTSLSAPNTGVRAVVETGWGLQLVQIEHGRGLVTVAADLAFAENRLIGTADHAEFLWQLARSLPDSREFLVFNRIERLSLWRWLTEHALAVLISSAALLVLWLWRIGPRFGPVVADLPPARRRLLDHLRASGRFHWNNRGRDRLAEAAREACLARLSRAHPGFASLPPGERATQLAAYAGISEAEAARLLAPRPVERGAEFIALMRALQQVHARLDHGA